MFFRQFFEQIQAFLDFLKIPIKFGDASDLKKEKNLISKIQKTLKQIWTRVFIFFVFFEDDKNNVRSVFVFASDSENVKNVVNKKHMLTKKIA